MNNQSICHYDEAKVPQFTIDPFFVEQNLSKEAARNLWENSRRDEVLNIFKTEMYGELPPPAPKVYYEELSCKENALNGTACRKEIRIHLENNGKSHYMDMLLYYPKNINSKVTTFIGLNFKGNQATTTELDVAMTGEKGQIPEILIPENRGSQAYRWQFEQLISKGYAAATICYHDIFPDRADGWNESVYNLFEDLEGFNGTHERYGAISAWAYGLIEGFNFLKSLSFVNEDKIIVHGHSRLGKSSLWAGVNNPKFAMVISNDSGCCGAAISKRAFGETVDFITNTFPHWFIKSLQKYKNNELAMKFDQHMLLALVAPRPLAVASASEDLWADPKGEYQSLAYASRLYNLYGVETLDVERKVAVDEFITGVISYHCRTGKHDQTEVDYKHYLEIVDTLNLGRM